MSNELNTGLGTSEVIWNLTDLYASPTDGAIAADGQACLADARDLEGRYAGRVDKLNAAELQQLVTALEALATRLGKLATYAFLNFTTRTRDANASALLQRVREIGSEAGKHTVFFELEWNKLEEAMAGELLRAPELAHYQHHLESLRRYAPHQLSREEERLLIEIAPAGRSSWTNLFEKIFGHLQFGERRRSEEEVLADLYHADRSVRRQAAADLTAGIGSQQHILTHVFNTLLTDKMIDDRLRRYPSWLSAMNLYNEVEPSTVAALVEAVTSRYDIVQRYYRLKRRLLELPELTDFDRYAPLPHLPDTTLAWQDAREMVLGAFAEFSPEAAAIAATFYDRRWIHAPILEGKRGGAFAHPCVPEVHPYVMVNYTGNIRDVSTVAHELGHGIHQYLAAGQGYFNSSTPLVLAETASVFAELLLFRHQLETLADPAQRRAFTCQKLESIFATVFRQVAMNRFEDRVHTARREEGELATETINRHWLATQQEMFGDSVALGGDYACWWSYIPHFVNSPGYVYSYAFGELLVLALYNLYLGDRKGFVPRYMAMLAAGGSRSPAALLAPFGIDLDHPTFWAGGLQLIDSMLQSVEE